MTITLLGNSLTAGKLGIAYRDYLDLPDEYIVKNRGRDGDTIKGLQKRLDDVLRLDNPDILIIQSGANDILLPEMAGRGGKWEPFVKDMYERGSIPADNADEFLRSCSDLFTAASSWGIERIIAVTISPLGENLDSPRNRKRERYNEILRRAAKECGIGIADVARTFEARLSDIQPVSDWFFDQPSSFTTDLRRIRRNGNARSLSEERGLYLTMDGAHLNEQGAQLMGKVLREAILH